MSSIPDDRERLRAWLRAAARHAAATYWRKERRVAQREAAVLNQANDDGEERIESLVAPDAGDGFVAVELRLWLGDLPERERMVLAGLFIERMREAELAVRMGCDQSTISRIKESALRSLREQFVNGWDAVHKKDASKRLY